MNTAEMKLEMFELLAQTKDKDKVTQLYEVMQDVLDSENDGWNDLSLEEQRKLDTAIEETYNPKKLIPHDDVLKMIDKWLKE
jgi:hypothetical protein